MPVMFNGKRLIPPKAARWEPEWPLRSKRHNHLKCQCKGCNCALTGYEDLAYCENCEIYCKEFHEGWGLAVYRHTEHELCGNSAEILLRELAE